MKIITKRMKIRETIDTWVNDGSGFNPIAKSRVLALNPDTASEKDIVDILGNTAWTEIICDECGEDVTFAVGIGDDAEGFDEPACWLCLMCARKSVGLLEDESVSMFRETIRKLGGNDEGGK